MGNIQKGKFDWNDLVYTSDELEISKYLLNKDNVLFNRTNSPGVGLVKQQFIKVKELLFLRDI